MCVYVRMYACMNYVCMYVFINAPTHVCMCVCMPVCMCAYTHVRIHAKHIHVGYRQVDLAAAYVYCSI